MNSNKISESKNGFKNCPVCNGQPILVCNKEIFGKDCLYAECKCGASYSYTDTHEMSDLISMWNYQVDKFISKCLKEG